MQNINRFIQFQWFLQKKRTAMKKVNQNGWTGHVYRKNALDCDLVVLKIGEVFTVRPLYVNLVKWKTQINDFRWTLAIAYEHISKIYCEWVIRISAFKMQSSNEKKKATNCELLIHIENAYWSDVLLCRSTEQHIHLLAHYTHTHAPKQYNARCHTVHLSVCQPEWNWANKICDHIYLSMLHRAYSPFTEWKCENKACFVRLKSIVQCERSYVCEMICNLNVFITTKRTALAIIKCLCAGIVCIWVCFVDLVFVVELYRTIWAMIVQRVEISNKTKQKRRYEVNCWLIY